MCCYENPLEPHFSIETPDFNILHVDSTLVYRSGQEATDLIIGTMPLLKALKDVNTDKPTILLSHYPFSSLMQDEKKYVSELLYRYGVRLWLAGHEHDHNLQPLKYLYSVQAGELRMEDKAHATVLIGNYDIETHHGYISAYTWFAEGWAEYPIIWHDYINENKFPFELRLPGYSGESRESVLIKNANRSYTSRMPEKVVNSILPDFEVSEKRYSAGILSLIHESWLSDEPHLIILADGGMGKSTMLLQACQNTQRALYVPVEGLDIIGYGIEQYCAVKLFNGSIERLQDFAMQKHKEPDLILMIDGLNEVGGDAERRFINEIKRLNMLKGIQVVISSRTDFTSRFSMTGYQVAHLLPLTDEQIREFFSDVTWSEIVNHPTLHHLLSNPMMLTMYMAVSPVIDTHKDSEFLHWRVQIDNSTDLLFNYYTAQIAVLLEREGITGEKALKAEKCVFNILPFIAYEYEKNFRFNISNKEFRELVKLAVKSAALDEENMELMSEHFRCAVPEVSYQDAIEILTNDLHLVNKGNEYTAFPHQIHRDYLAAYWIFRETERTEETDVLNALWNRNTLSRSVMNYIRQLSVNCWLNVADKIHTAAMNREEAFNLTENLLDCFPYTDKSGIPDYSGLNLSGLQLPDYSLTHNEISLRDAKIDEISIGKLNAKPIRFNKLKFSEDNAYLAANEGSNVVIFPLRSNEKVFRYYVGGGLSCLDFVGDYLFAVIGNTKIVVFKYCDTWSYVCEITSTGGSAIFNQRLKQIILRDEILYFYFNNREWQYRLSDGRMIKNIQKKHVWEKAVEGYNLTYLSTKQPQSRHKAPGEICKVEHMGLTAAAGEDGSLIVSGGNEIYNVLNRGITLLKDGSISGDGKWAVTLSHELFGKTRKIQLWSLDSKKKIAELYCPQEINGIHLSQYGAWIVGETEKQSWVYNINNDSAEWYKEHFISNQRSKLITYGDCVFRKNDNNLVYLYNLKTGECTDFKNLSKSARMAAFMPDGSLASVGNNARMTFFKNTRNGSTAQVNRQSTTISGIFPLKKQPFIAVATQDKIISIYHTGTEQRLRIIETVTGNHMVSVHPEESVIACSNGQRFETHNFYEKQYEDKKRGWWYPNPYKGEHRVNGNVLDLAFNSANHELVVILSNGEIIFCHEKYCGYHSSLDIITNFNISAYDFRGCICSGEIREQLRQNGALI